MQGPGDGPPQVPGIQVADVGGALWCVIGILAALHERERTGRGRMVDVSMMDGAIPFAAFGWGFVAHSVFQVDNSAGNLSDRLSNTAQIDLFGGTLALVSGSGVQATESMGLLRGRNTQPGTVQVLTSAAPGSTRYWVRPAAWPSSAVSTLPVSIMSMTRAVPISRGRRTDPPPPRKSPRWPSGSA